MRASRVLVAALLAAAGLGGCGESSSPDVAVPVELAHFPIDEGDVPAGSAARFDREITQDGRGSLRVEGTGAGARLRLYEIDDPGIVQGQVMLTGFLRSQDLNGQAMLELRCQPHQGEEAFVRGVRRHASGQTGWTPQEIRFADPSLCRDPDAIRINLLIIGEGTVWVDNLRIWSVPLD